HPRSGGAAGGRRLDASDPEADPRALPAVARPNARRALPGAIGPAPGALGAFRRRVRGLRPDVGRGIGDPVDRRQGDGRGDRRESSGRGVRGSQAAGGADDARPHSSAGSRGPAPRGRGSEEEEAGSGGGRAASRRGGGGGGRGSSSAPESGRGNP